MEKFPVSKNKTTVKSELQGILNSLDTIKRTTPKTEENLATMETQDVVLKPNTEPRKKPIIKKQERPLWTQNTPQEAESIPEVSPEDEEDLPMAEEVPEQQIQKTEVVKTLEEEYDKTRIEIAQNLLDRAIVNDDITLAFTQYNILRTKTKKDTDDYKWQLKNLIKKISAQERKKYEDAVHSIPPEDPKRLVATRRRALIEESLGKYKAALENDKETVELPEDVQESPEDEFPKTIDTNLRVKMRQQTTDAQRDMLPYLFNNALKRKDYMTAYDQLGHSKKVAPEMYAEYNSRILEALNEEITTLEKTITDEKEKSKKTGVQKFLRFFKKPAAEPEDLIIKTSEQKILQFQELKATLSK